MFPSEFSCVIFLFLYGKFCVVRIYHFCCWALVLILIFFCRASSVVLVLFSRQWLAWEKKYTRSLSCLWKVIWHHWQLGIHPWEAARWIDGMPSEEGRRMVVLNEVRMHFQNPSWISDLTVNSCKIDLCNFECPYETTRQLHLCES